ncbi:MAG: hypothetical protein ACI4JF_04355 [Oscillospiraceae bacterium]
MIKKIAAVSAAAALCLSLSSCMSAAVDTAEKIYAGGRQETSAVQENTPAVTEAVTEAKTEQTTVKTEAQTEKAEEKPLSLYDLSSAKIRNNSLSVYSGEPALNTDEKSRLLFEGTLADLDIIGDRAARIDGYEYPEYNAVRCSTGTLVTEDSENYYGTFFNSRINTDCYRPLVSDFVTPYSILCCDPIMVLEPYEYNYIWSEKIFDCREIVYAYTAEVTGLNCFIRYTDEFNYEIIPDPAYMYGLPVYHSTGMECTYDINGVKVRADTIKAYADVDSGDGAELRKAAGRADGKYFYGKISGTISCCYSSKDGYISPHIYNADTEYYYAMPTSISVFELISEDTDKILSEGVFAVKDDGGIYNTLMNSRHTFMNDCVCGLRLIDINDDDFPELFVSRLEAADNLKAYVDIYDISGGSTRLLGTTETNSGYQNNICLAATPEGDKWIFQSRIDIDKGGSSANDTVYIMSLNDGALEFQRYFAIDYKPDENRMTVVEPIFMGAPLEYKTGIADGKTVYSYGWISSDSLRGLLTKLYGNFLSDNVKEFYALNSQWLSNVTSANEAPGRFSNSIRVISQDDRAVAAHIAFMTEKWYEYGNNYIEGFYPPADIFE